MNQQQNWQRQKGPQQNVPRKSGRAIKTCTVKNLAQITSCRFREKRKTA